MAVFRGFQLLRTLRSRTFFGDDRSRERNALATFRLASQRPIGLAGADRTITRRFAHIALPNCIANADDHRTSQISASHLELLRMISKAHEKS